MPLKRTLTTMSALFCLALPAIAATPSDVPAKHWARPSVESVTSKKLMDAPGGLFHGNRYVTRYELAATLDRFVQYIEAGKTPLHPTVRPKSSIKIPAHASTEIREALTRLATNSFISPDSVLLEGSGSEPVTEDQLRTILTQVIIRLSDRATAPQPGS